MSNCCRLYTMFKEEYRSDDAVMLLLNMIVLFDPNVDGLSNTASVRAEQNKYKLCLKRYGSTAIIYRQLTLLIQMYNLSADTCSPSWTTIR